MRLSLVELLDVDIVFGCISKLVFLPQLVEGDEL